MKPDPPPSSPPGHDPRSAPAGHQSASTGRADEHAYTREELHNDDVAHEESDVNVRAIALFAAGLVVVGIVSGLLTLLLFDVFAKQAAANDPSLSPLAVPATEMPPRTETPYFGGAPSPQLLTNEPAVLKQLRQNEEQQLHDYGWVDQKTGVVRIPIDEAKKLILQRGLPARKDVGEDATFGTHAPAYGESSGGRTISTRRPAPPAPAGGSK